MIVFSRVVERQGARTGRQVFAMNDDGTDLRQLTFEAPGTLLDTVAPRLSPDGRHIAAATSRHYAETGGTLELRSVDPAAGGAPLRLTDNLLDDQAAGWLDGGAALAVVQADVDSGAVTLVRLDLGALPALPPAPTPLADLPPDTYEAALSPDGGRLAYIRGTPGTPVRVLMVHDLGTGAEAVLTAAPVRAEGVRWAADGARLIYAANHHDAPFGPMEAYACDPVAGPDGEATGRQRLSFGALGDGVVGLCWAGPDRAILARAEGGASQLWLLDAATGAQTRLTDGADDSLEPDWHPAPLPPLAAAPDAAAIWDTPPEGEPADAFQPDPAGSELDLTAPPSAPDDAAVAEGSETTAPAPETITLPDDIAPVPTDDPPPPPDTALPTPDRSPPMTLTTAPRGTVLVATLRYWDANGQHQSHTVDVLTQGIHGLRPTDFLDAQDNAVPYGDLIPAMAGATLQTAVLSIAYPNGAFELKTYEFNGDIGLIGWSRGLLALADPNPTGDALTDPPVAVLRRELPQPSLSP